MLTENRKSGSISLATSFRVFPFSSKKLHKDY